MTNDVQAMGRDSLRDKYPGLAKRAERSPLAAIRLHCIDCVGGRSAEVAECTSPGCFLYPFRFARRPPIGPDASTGDGVLGSRNDDRGLGGHP